MSFAIQCDSYPSRVADFGAYCCSCCCQVHLLGFSWAGADEGKMRSTFGVGMTDFGRFMDLQQVAQGLGYHNFGLARLTRQVRV